MNPYFLIGCFSVAVLIAVVAFLRERRLRQALEKLLQRLLQIWRAHDKRNH